MLPRLRVNPLPVRRHVEALVLAGAVERHRVESVLTFHDVTSFAWVPLEAVVTGAEKSEVGSPTPIDEVVAVSAQERLVPPAADQLVVGETAVDRELQRGGVERGCVDSVVARTGVHGQHVERRVRRSHVDRCREAGDSRRAVRT